jgi:hypothetical protein
MAKLIRFTALFGHEDVYAGGELSIYKSMSSVSSVAPGRRRLRGWRNPISACDPTPLPWQILLRRAPLCERRDAGAAGLNKGKPWHSAPAL